MSTLIERNPEIMATAIDGEFVMMSIETGKYYGLNNIGSRIWELIEKKSDVTSICHQLTEEYNVIEDECNQQVIELLEQMKAQNIINTY
ncbi:lasso peptide biosynthesis PqqD family chaperone [Pedobacter sp. BAL39]|uniref:lasso peptide biosynthesis PqqD family chaperone n=1 Tax=Pedobacter sp. BAL39 TaxID=391596 RepID=UPI001E49E257|nr:lasso peptide biosynthesis PqqD family chaperone [Pedobacter sp. BAL39]